MGAATNIPITATTTGFQSAIDAARRSINNFDRDINQNIIQSFRALDRETRNYEQGLGRVTRLVQEQAAAAVRSTQSMASGFQSAGKSLSTYLTAPLLLAGGAAFKAYADIDSMNQGLKVVAGSAEGAARQFKEFYAISQKPGLGLEQTVAAGLQLETLGYKAQTAEKYISEVGNAIALGGKGKVEFGQVITQFTQMAGKAKVMGDDLKPIINASPVIGKAITDMFGSVDSEQISKKLQAAGKGPKDFIAALVGELSKLDRVESGPKNALENFGDAATIAGYSVGKAADEVFGLTGKLNGIGNGLGRMATAFGESNFAVKATTFSVLGTAAALGPLALGIGYTIKAYQSMTLATSAFRVGLAALVSPIGIAIAAGVALTALGYAVYNASKPVVDLVSKTQLLSSVNQTATESITAERVELDHLYKTATDESKSKEQRRKAIVALNNLSPDYLGFLNLENINSLAAAEAIRKQGEAILFRAKARAGEDKLAELSKKRFDVEQKPVSDFEKPFSAKVNPLTGVQEILSPNQLKDQARQYKNDALLAIDANIADISNYIEKNERRATRRGISVDVPISPVVKLNEGEDSAYEKLKADVEASKLRIRNFVSEHGKGVKVPVALQLDYTRKAGKLKVADDAVKDITPKTPKVSQTATIQATGNLAILKRYIADLETQIQNLGGKAPQKLVEQLSGARSALESLQGLTSKDQKVSITGIKEITDPNLSQKAKAIVNNFHQIKATTPGLFAKTGAEKFLNALDKAKPGLDAYVFRIQEIQAAIGEATVKSNDFAASQGDINALAENMRVVKQANRAQENATGSAEIKADTSRSTGGSAAKNVFSSAGVSSDSVQTMLAQVAAAKDAVNQSVGQLATAMDAGQQQLRSAAVGLLSSFGDAVAQGKDPLKGVLGQIISTIAGFIIQLGEALLFSSAALLAAAPLSFGITLAPGLSQQLAGAGLIVAGAAVKGLAMKGFAKGGVFDRPSVGLFGEYAGATRNREIATPESLMVQIFRKELSRNNERNPFERLQSAYSGGAATQRVEVSVSGRLENKHIYLAGKRYADGLPDIT